MVTLIVAMDEDGLIGRGDKLPWRLPEDLKQFRARTMGHVCIMGRATWQSLPTHAKGKPYLDGRVNYVVTRSPAKHQAESADKATPFEGPHFVDTVELALRRAPREFPEAAGEIFILGGQQIYELVLRRNLVGRMIITRVKGKHIGDVTFPDLPTGWKETVLDTNADFDVVELRK